MHVVQTECVRLETADRDCLIAAISLAPIAVCVVSIVVSLVSTDSLTRVERGGRARPAGVFPLGLGGKPNGHACPEPCRRACLAGQRLAEGCRVVPRHLLHRALRAFELAGVFARDGLVLLLRDLASAHVEGLGDGDAVPWAFVALAPAFACW